jgi:hypothetical protein
VDEEVRAVGVRVEDQRPVPVVRESSRIIVAAQVSFVPAVVSPVSIVAPGARVRNERNCSGDERGDSPV